MRLPGAIEQGASEPPNHGARTRGPQSPNTAASLLISQQLPDPEAGKKRGFSFSPVFPTGCQCFPLAEFNQHPVSKGVRENVLEASSPWKNKGGKKKACCEAGSQEGPVDPRTDYNRKHGGNSPTPFTYRLCMVWAAWQLRGIGEWFLQFAVL